MTGVVNELAQGPLPYLAIVSHGHSSFSPTNGSGWSRLQERSVLCPGGKRLVYTVLC